MLNSSISDSDMAALRQKLTAENEMRPFPTTVQKLMDECKKPEPEFDVLTRLIECDSVLASRLLAMANSPMVASRRPISTVAHGLVVLGMQSVLKMATAIATSQMFECGSQCTLEYRKSLYQRALGCAAVNRVLSQNVVQAPEDEAFLVGVMQDVGQLVFLDVLDNDYIEQGSDLTTNPIELENRLFGVDHAAIGRLCANRWGLPYDIYHAIGNHHANPIGSEHKLSQLSCLGQHYANLWGLAGALEAEARPDLEDCVPQSQAMELEAEAREVYASIVELCGIN